LEIEIAQIKEAIGKEIQEKNIMTIKEIFTVIVKFVRIQEATGTRQKDALVVERGNFPEENNTNLITMKISYLFFLVALIEAYHSFGQPIGSVVAYAGEIAVVENDSTYMNCDGRLLRIKDFPKLFKAIGWSYLCKGDSINKEFFRLPDYQGYFLRGVDPTGKIDKGMYERTNLSGTITGSLVGSIQQEGFKSHDHPIADPGHNHGMLDDNLSGGRRTFNGAEVTMFYSGQRPKPNTMTGITVSEKGDKETRPTNIAVYWIIKIK
jgi:microcystin-dependent protein